MKKQIFQIKISLTKYLFKIKSKSLTIIERIYWLLLEPKKVDEENHRKELVCNILLVFISLFLITLDILVLINYTSAGNEYIGINPYLMLLITGSAFYLLYLSRAGHSENISQGIIWLLIAGGTYGQMTWGADLPSVILLWSFIITTSSILISTSYSFYLSICIGFGTLLLQILASRGVLKPIITWKNHGFKFDDAIEYAVTFILIAGVSWISNREIYRSLNKATHAKAELQKERDILETKVIERTEELHKAQVEKINNMYQLVEFGRISSGLFHDLISPLNTLSLSISQMKDRNESGYQENQTQFPRINDIQNQIYQCERVSKRLISFMNIARRQISKTDDRSVFEICKEIRNTICILESKARQNNITIVFSAQKNINTFGSVTLFSHIMTNLISNAIDAYTSLNISDVYRRKIIIYCIRKKRQIVIKVKDFGLGIPTEVQPHIFETFFTTKSDHGCGIGLSATKHALEKYFHGSIFFISNTEHGTTFTIKIPIVKDENQYSQPNDELRVSINSSDDDIKD